MIPHLLDINSFNFGQVIPSTMICILPDHHLHYRDKLLQSSFKIILWKYISRKKMADGLKITHLKLVFRHKHISLLFSERLMSVLAGTLVQVTIYIDVKPSAHPVTFVNLKEKNKLPKKSDAAPKSLYLRPTVSYLYNMQCNTRQNIEFLSQNSK